MVHVTDQELRDAGITSRPIAWNQYRYPTLAVFEPDLNFGILMDFMGYARIEES
jgi:hypothetical protein